MREVYIRSQNKEQLFVFNNHYGIKYAERDKGIYIYSNKETEKQNEKHCIFLILRSGEWQKLGEYKSKERCIEIIDEIQKKCGQYLYREGSLGLIRDKEVTSYMVAEIPRIYQMPEK